MSPLKFELKPGSKTTYLVSLGTVQCGELYIECDGYYVWEPENRVGYLSDWFLQAIVDELNRLNAAWHEVLTTALTNIGTKTNV